MLDRRLNRDDDLQGIEKERKDVISAIALEAGGEDNARRAKFAAELADSEKALEEAGRDVGRVQYAGRDDVVLRLNEEALRALTCEARLEVVPRATHLFEEPGALERVAERAAAWFERHLATGAAGAGR